MKRKDKISYLIHELGIEISKLSTDDRHIPIIKNYMMELADVWALEMKWNIPQNHPKNERRMDKT